MSAAGKRGLLRWVCSLVVLGLTATAGAEIVTYASFTEGSGAASADQWTGAAGNGWSNGWSVPVNQTSQLPMMTASVSSANPLSGGGNYLSVVNAPSDTLQANLQSHITRDVDFTLVSPTAVNSVSFNVRLDKYTAGADYLTFYDVVNGGGASNPYLGAPHTSWRVNLDGTGAWEAFSGTATTPTLSTVKRIVGDTYTVELALNYSAGTYSATFTNLDWDESDGGTASHTLSNLQLKSTAGFGAEFAFGARVTANTTLLDEALNYSVDTISIGANVPEPATGLLGSAGVTMLASRRRRRAH
jgi:hypothetical protein